MSQKERRRYGLQLAGVLRHLLLGTCIIMADYSLFWLMDLVQHHLRGEIVARGGQHSLRWDSTLRCFAGRGFGVLGAPFPRAELLAPQRQWSWA